jgi:3-keto-disaccharide hydrolase
VGALECAVLSRFKGRPLAAARLFKEAFAKQSGLADKGLDRYGAACAAVMAGAGLGEDAASLSEEERARWRKQGLDWLRADLKAMAQALDADAGKAVVTVHPALVLWQADADLASVRDEPELSRLPKAERDAWKALWADVATLRRRADIVPTGGWRVEGKEIVQGAKIDGSSWLPIGDPEWTDYDFELEALRVEGIDGFGIGVRLMDRENHLMANLGGWGNTWHAVEVTTQGGVSVPRSPQKQDSIKDNRWYKVRVEVRADRFKVFLDGEELLTFTESTHPRGCVGVRSWNTINRFRNLKVTDPKGKVLFEGIPPSLAGKKPVTQ